MASVTGTKSDRIRPPFDYAAITNNFGVLKFSGGVLATETSHVVNVLPDDWMGQYLEIYVTGGDMHYAFSMSSTAEVDRAVSATEAGASVKVGGVIPNGATRYVQVPVIKMDGTTDGHVYFSRESSATGTIAYVRLAGF